MATYKTIITDLGQAKLANAVALGVPVSITQMAVGDGNGNPTEPNAAQVALVRETFRAAVNRLIVDDENAARVIAELVVPTDQGGWTVHEVGVFDSDGDLFAVANFPPTYKPLIAEGATRDLVVRTYIEHADVASIELVIDPSVAIASQQWVEDNYSIAAQLPGGTTFQVLRKVSNADGDTEWADPTEVNVITGVVKEVQTLADGQTVLNLATAITTGLALYIEGSREEGWVANSQTQLTLDRTYPAGTEVYLFNNDPLGAVQATEETLGLVELSTLEEAKAGADTTRAMAPYQVHQAFKQFGLGAVSFVIDDLNTLTTPGLYYAVAAPNSPGGGNGYVLVQGSSATIAAQTYLVAGSDKMYFRRQVDPDGWQPWREIYHSGSVIPIGNGGTGATDEPAARAALDVHSTGEAYSRFAHKSVELIAHRGFKKQAPENTLLAFSSSLSRGARSWETDVQPSADGTMYLFHDDTVDALTDGTGTFTALTDATINGLRFDSTAGTMFADTGISTLAGFLTLAKRHGIFVYLEIKAKRTIADVDAMAQAVIDAGMESLCMFTSFDVADIQRVRQTLPSVPVGLASYDQVNYQAQIDGVAALGNCAIVWAYEDLLAIPDIVTYAHGSNVEVIAWTVDDPAVVGDLMAIGVRRIMSDISTEV